MEMNLVIALGGILGSGISAYVGVKVGFAEMRRDIDHLQADVQRNSAESDKRFDRLEAVYFKQRGVNADD